MALAALLVLVLIAGGLTFGWSRFGRSDAAPASIAVLSFRNLSAGDPYFAEGIGEETSASSRASRSSASPAALHPGNLAATLTRARSLAA